MSVRETQKPGLGFWYSALVAGSGQLISGRYPQGLWYLGAFTISLVPVILSKANTATWCSYLLVMAVNFSSTVDALSIFQGLGCAVMLGASRKSFIAHLTGAEAPDRLPGSIAAAVLGAAQGVQFLRVHDVAATRQALAVWEEAMAASPSTLVDKKPR